MTIDLSNISYKVVAILSDGTQIYLSSAAQNIAWEENESELAVRLNLTIRDVAYEGGRLATKLALCTVVYLYANWGMGEKEIFRGTIWEWQHSEMHDDEIVITCYDQLYYLQKSQDNRYYAKGTGTKKIIMDICSAWKVPQGVYAGPDVKHKKILYKSKTIAAMIKDALADAKDLGGVEAFARSAAGKIDILPFGSNEDVFLFKVGENLSVSTDKYSMVNLVTRVVVTGKDDSKGRPKVVATIDGKTEYGILQTFHAKGDATTAEAKKAAQKIIDEKGKPTRTTTLRAPDFPLIRKGDKIYVETDAMKGYYYVKGVSHNATNGLMNMEVKPV